MITEKQTQQVADVVLDGAYEIFSLLGVADDFCIQTIGASKIVFGGTNRVCWSVRNGFSPDKSYCTKGFLTKWQTKIDRSYRIN